MPGRDSVESKVSALSLDDHEELYDIETSGYSTQLEDLQQLLEIANQNEENAKKSLTDMTSRLEASKHAFLEMKLQLDMSKAQAKLTIDSLQTTVRSLSSKHDTAIDFSETCRKERDQAVYHQNEEKSKNVKLQLSLNDLKLDIDQLSASHAKKSEDIAKLKKIILTQSHMLNSRDSEIVQLKASLENKHPFPHTVQVGGPTFFREASESSRAKPEIQVLIPTRSIHKDW